MVKIFQALGAGRSTGTACVRLLTLVGILGLVLATSACSSFKRKSRDEAATRRSTDNNSMNSMPASAPAEHPTAADEELVPTGGAMQSVYFDYDSADIRQDQLSHVEADLKYLQDNPTVKVQVEGNCDERGTTEYNFSLGERRGNAVRDYLAKGGVGNERLRVVSKGEEAPAVEGSGERAWAKNRRVEFKFIRPRAR